MSLNFASRKNPNQDNWTPGGDSNPDTGSWSVVEWRIYATAKSETLKSQVSRGVNTQASLKRWTLFQNLKVISFQITIRVTESACACELLFRRVVLSNTCRSSFVFVMFSSYYETEISISAPFRLNGLFSSYINFGEQRLWIIFSPKTRYRTRKKILFCSYVKNHQSACVKYQRAIIFPCPFSSSSS